MRALLDTCILLDAMQNREPFSQPAQEIFLCAANDRFRGCITAKAATDIYYLMHRYTHDDKASRKALNSLFMLFEVLDTAGMDCRRAIASDVADYEDAVMVETALRAEVDCIVTRNLRDYAKSAVPVLAPETFLQRLADEPE